MKQSDLADQWACAVCKRLLNEVVTLDGPDAGSTLTHSQAADHEVVPVRASEIDAMPVCDFCGTPYPQWWVPATDFQTMQRTAQPGTPNEHTVAGQSVGDWGACNLCAALVAKRAWSTLTTRVLSVSVVIRSHLAEGSYTRGWIYSRLSTMYAELGNHMTGEPYPREI